MDGPVTERELEQLRAAAVATMFDWCKVGIFVPPVVGPASLPGTWTYGTETVCGVYAGRSKEVLDGSQATLTDCTIRLPHGTAVTATSRIEVTGRMGSSLSASEFYAVTGAPQVGQSAVVCPCRRIVEDSVL